MEHTISEFKNSEDSSEKKPDVALLQAAVHFATSPEYVQDAVIDRADHEL